MEIYPKPPSIAQPLPSTPEPSLYDQVGNLSSVYVHIDQFPVIAPETSDSPRINRAIQYIASLNTISAELKFRAGQYNISSRINPIANLILKGTSAAGMFGSTAGATVFKLTNGANCDMIYGADGVDFVHLIDIQLDGNKANQTTASIGVNIADANAQEGQWLLERCFIHDFYSDNVYIGNNRRAVRLLNTIILSAGGNGITVYASDCVIDNSTTGLNTGDGIAVKNWMCRIKGGDVFTNGCGIHIYSGAAHTFISGGVSCDRNKTQGIKVDGSYTSIIGVSFRLNSQLTNNIYAHVDISDTTGTTAIQGCTFAHETDPADPNNPSYDVYLGSGASCIYMGNTRSSDASTYGVCNDITRLKGYKQLYNSSSIPSANIFGQGDLIENTGASVGSNSLWQCVRAGKAHGNSTGSTTSGSNQVTGVTNTSSWSIGDPIMGANIPYPTTVSAVDTTNNILTISQNAVGTGAGITLYDAQFSPVGIVGASKLSSQSDSTAIDVATLQTDFNNLLAKLRTAGLM